MSITTLYLTGFEMQNANANGLGLWDALNGTAPSFFAAARNGTACAQLSPAAATSNLVKTIAAGNKWVCRFAIKCTVRPSANQILAHFAATTSGAIPTMTISSTGQLALAGSLTTGATGPTIDTTSWHLIEWQLDMSANPWVMRWKVDGVAQPNAQHAAAADTLLSFRIGTNASSTYTCCYDDFILGSCTVTGAAADWYGDGKVLAQLAGSDGTHSTVTSFAFGDAGAALSGTVTTAYTMLDEVLWSAVRSTTDNVAQIVSSTTSYMEIAPSPAAQGVAANAVRALLSYSSPTTTANTAGCIIRDSAGAATVLFGDLPVAQGGLGGALADYSETGNFFKGVVVTAPAAGWTASEVNALRWRFGGSNDISPVPTVQALMLEVDWPVYPPPFHARRPKVTRIMRSRGRF